MPAPDLDGSSASAERYSRQILFPGIGEAGQRALSGARVAIAGVGATGAATASLLARAGVGRLRLIDRDFVEFSNLQRQILFDEQDARDALPKAEAARRKILQFNSAVTVEASVADLIPGNIHQLCGDADLVLDCTDNFETRYLINDFAVEQGKPWIYAAAIGAYGATMTILPRRSADDSADHESPYEPTACLACLFPAPPAGPVETCDTAGILASAVNLVAAIQVTEALKMLTGQWQKVRRTLLSFDLWENERSAVAAGTPNPECRVCGVATPRVFTHLEGRARAHITLCGRNSVQIHEHHRPTDLMALERQLGKHLRSGEIEGLRANAMLLRFRRGANVVTVFPDGRALIQGTTDAAVARSLYARFLGN